MTLDARGLFGCFGDSIRRVLSYQVESVVEEVSAGYPASDRRP